MTEEAEPTAEPKPETTKEEYEAEIARLNERVSQRDLHNRTLRDRVADQKASLDDAYVVNRQLRAGPAMAPMAITMGLLVAVMFMVLWVNHQIPDATAVTCPAAVECPACETCAAEPTAPTDPLGIDSERGYYLQDDPHLHPWPDASHYPADIFAADCHSVCETRTFSTDELGRVLTMDPEHLVCICLRPTSPWPVTRWINWVQVR